MTTVPGWEDAGDLPSGGIHYAEADVELTRRMYDQQARLYLEARWYCQATWSWTNWTIGIWWNRSTRRSPWPCFGIDVGPLEAVWRKEPITRHLNRSKAPRRKDRR